MQLTLKMPVTEQEIKEEIAKLRPEIALRQTEMKMLAEAIKHYQKQCSHPGQKTGHNERDGSWGNPCPICGYGY